MTAVGELAAFVESTLDDFPVLDVPEDVEEVPLLASLPEVVHAARSLHAVTQKRAQVAAAGEEEIGRLREALRLAEEWLAEQDRPLAVRAEYLSGLLERFALAERAAGRGKTLSTPYVRVSTREVPGTWTVGDEAVAWAEKNRPELVQVRRSVPVAAARGAWVVTESGVIDLSTGELVPGVEVSEERVTATVKVLVGGVRG